MMDSKKRCIVWGLGAHELKCWRTLEGGKDSYGACFNVGLMLSACGLV